MAGTRRRPTWGIHKRARTARDRSGESTAGTATENIMQMLELNILALSIERILDNYLFILPVSRKNC